VACSRPIEGNVREPCLTRLEPYVRATCISGRGNDFGRRVGRAFWPGREALSALQRGAVGSGSAVRPAVVRFDRNRLTIGRWPTGWRWRCDARGVLGRASSVIQQTLERAGLRRAVAGSPTQPAGLVGAMTTSGVGRGLAQAIRGRVFLPGQPGFGSAAHVFNTRFDAVVPLAVARAVDARDVRDAVRFTVSHGVRVRARSGGHSYAGYSTLSDGVVLDLRRLNWVKVDQRNRTATIGAGSQLIGVSSALAPIVQ
jgi:hypothetical protein